MPSHATAFAPGRLNLIGEHTDYNDGLALPCAISQGITVTARRGGQPRVEVHARELSARDAFDLHQPPHAHGWRAFTRGTVAELQRAGVQLPGVKLEISGDVPRGAGLSSSAALEVALSLALIAVAGAEVPDRVELARLCSRVENEWVGARTGLLDQLASLFGEAGHAVLIDFRTLELAQVPLRLERCRLVTLDSGERHNLSASGYNERRGECARACQELGISSLRDATLEMATALPAPIGLRVRHVVSENERVSAAVGALQRGDLGELGRLISASHASLRDDYAVSTDAVEHAVQRLMGAGALGARIVGGGFGGHVLGLLPADAPAPDGATEVRPGPGARVLE